jgi:pimeloyl-ACP methyl ester carboxylesterase
MSDSTPSAKPRSITFWRAVSALILLAAIPLGAIAGRTVHHARVMLHPVREPVTAAQRVRAHELMPNLLDVELRTADGLVLPGWFASGHKRDGIVLVHGLGGNRAALLDEAALLARRGHGVLLYDSRASGESPGKLASWGDQEQRDVRAALDFLSARAEVDSKELGVYGFSVGSTAAVMEAAGDLRVRAIGLGPLWPSLDDELADKFSKWGRYSRFIARRVFLRAGIDVDSLDARAAVAKLPPRPVLFIAGDQDRDTPPAEMRADQAADPAATLVFLAGAGHGNYAAIAPLELDRHLGGFFDTNLGVRK